MFKKDKLELHTTPKQPVQINRPLIITASIVVATILMLTIISALTTTKKPEAKSTIKVDTNKPTVISPALQGLPGSYQDIAGIKKYLSGSENPQLSMLMRKFGQLQNDYASLKKQLSEGRPSEPVKPRLDPKTEEAKKSELIFSAVSTSADNMVGPSANAKSRLSNRKSQENIVPTPEQGELIKQQERDKQKLAVMQGKDKPEDIYDLHNVVTPVSPYQIQAGTLIPATLITGIDTALPGTLIAQVRSNMYDTVTGRHLLIPKGSKLLGKYDTRRVVTGASRVLLTFDRIIRPDGSSILLGNSREGALGVDNSGQSGLEGNVNNHWGRVLGAATISTILSVGAGVAAGSSTDNSTNPSQRGFSAAGSKVADIGNTMVSKSANIRPTISLEPGHQFNLAVRRDMVLTPYKPRGYK